MGHGQVVKHITINATEKLAQNNPDQPLDNHRPI